MVNVGNSVGSCARDKYHRRGFFPAGISTNARPPEMVETI